MADQRKHLSPQKRSVLGVVGFSALAHLALFGWIGFYAPKPRFRDISPPQALDLWLSPKRNLQEALNDPYRRASTPTKTRSGSGRIASGLNSAASVPAEAPAPGGPSKITPGSADVAQPGASSPEVDAGVRAALRSRLGCDADILALTPEERQDCNQRAAETAKRGPKYIDVVPAEKRAYYDAVQAAYQASRHPDAPYYRDANGVIQAWGSPPAVGCAFRRSFRPGSTLADKIKATGMIGVPIGPLSCGLALPQGSMTPELGIPVP